jgi:hypothetical protein
LDPGLASESDTTEENVADDGPILDRDQTEIGNEGRRPAQCLNETRLGRLTKGELVNSEDLLVICWPLRPDRQHAVGLAFVPLRVGVEQQVSPAKHTLTTQGASWNIFNSSASSGACLCSTAPHAPARPTSGTDKPRQIFLQS